MPTLDLPWFTSVESEQLPQTLRELIEAAPMPSLGHGPRDEPLAQALTVSAICLQRVPPLGLAGLWLLAGELDASHAISQSSGESNGSFWHAIMHRREGDFENAKYWFRRVGRHRVLHALAATPYGDPMQFVDACQSAQRGTQAGVPTSDELRELQWLEWQHLFAHCLGLCPS